MGRKSPARVNCLILIVRNAVKIQESPIFPKIAVLNTFKSNLIPLFDTEEHPNETGAAR